MSLSPSVSITTGVRQMQRLPVAAVITVPQMREGVLVCGPGRCAEGVATGGQQQPTDAHRAESS